MSKPISALAPGNMVKLNESGTPIKFIFLQYNHYGKNEVTLIRNDITQSLGGSIDQSDRASISISKLHMLLKSEYVYTLDPIIRGSLIPVDLSQYFFYDSGGGSYRTIETACFVLSRIEIGLPVDGNAPTEGTPFSYFSGNASRIAYLNFPEYSPPTPTLYGLRSMHISDSKSQYGIDHAGASAFNNSRSYANYRPVLTLSSQITVSDAPDQEGCYNIIGAPAAEQYQKKNGIWLKMV